LQLVGRINSSANPHAQLVGAVAAGLALVLGLFGGALLCLRVRGPSGVRLLGLGAGLAGVVLLLLIAALAPQLGRVTSASGRMTDYQLGADPDGSVLHLSGLLGPGVATGFDALLQQHPQARRLVIDSYGGLIDQSLLLAGSVVSHRLEVVVHQHCASACLVPFLASAHRYAEADALFGFHSPGPIAAASPWLRVGAAREGLAYVEFLRSHGLPQKYLDLVRDTPLQSIARVSAVELAEAGVLQTVNDAGAPLPLEQARWGYIAATMREAGTPGGAESAELMRAIQRSGNPAAQKYGEPLYRALQADDAAQTRQVVASLTATVTGDAIHSASPASITAFMRVQDQVLQDLVAKQDWRRCALYANTAAARPTENGDSLVPAAMQPALFRSMVAVIDSAATNQWHHVAPDAATGARVTAITQDVARRVYAQGYGAKDLSHDERASCLFTAGIYHEFSGAAGDLPGIYLSALVAVE
jgi:hypothetical protein